MKPSIESMRMRNVSLHQAVNVTWKTHHNLRAISTTHTIGAAHFNCRVAAMRRWSEPLALPTKQCLICQASSART